MLFRSDGPETRALLLRYLRPLLDAGTDTLVLGCTHYPTLRASLARSRPDTRWIDSGGVTAKAVDRLLRDRNEMQVQAARLLGERVQGRARKVALSVDANDAELGELVAALKPDLLQLHGKETIEIGRAHV